MPQSKEEEDHWHRLSLSHCLGPTRLGASHARGEDAVGICVQSRREAPVSLGARSAERSIESGLQLETSRSVDMLIVGPARRHLGERMPKRERECVFQD